ncbi:MAG: (deoxy)nucleoside triphosphate pyrophosphohydrolase [Gammaproteobacteria bacterium]|nr:(deoxy)nucleoside triphosphate pyrophosphohydrolase [Gammaproteobacteria bacterium]
MRVVAGALLDRAGLVLIAQRPRGKVLAGRWEFPGGKLADGESPSDALQRELREELGIDVRQFEWVLDIENALAKSPLTLHCFVVTEYVGEPQPRDGQALEWVPIEQLSQHDILEADQPFIEALQRRFGRAR